MIEFRAWPKIPRLYEEKITVTEKLDGTNACIVIDEDGNLGCQSRSRLITPEDDNYGFAQWVNEHKEELLTLGVGHHFGEWWGQGIQRGYELKEKRFSLFNTNRWNSENIPSCCHVVPVLGDNLDDALDEIIYNGSKAAPGYTKAEGIIVYRHLAKVYYKVIINK